MDAELIALADRLLDGRVDWEASPPEEGRDPGYALGLALFAACLHSPSLAPLAEALTRPQPPARPTDGERSSLLADPDWESPFLVVCGRMLTRGPWQERALEIAEALAVLGERAADVASTVVRLLLSTAEQAGDATDELLARLEELAPGNARLARLRRLPPPSACALVFVDELCANPRLLALYLEHFADLPGASLLVYAPGWTPAEAVARLEPLLAAAGELAERAEVTALAVEASAANDAAAAAAATVLLSAHEAVFPFGELERIGPATTPTALTSRRPRDYLALCVIFKNEARYLAEWIEFHRIVGVDHFFLYENHSDDDYAAVLEPYIRAGIVTLHPWPLDVGQNAAYTHCTTEYADRVEWIGFVDADEFFFAPDGDLRAALAEFDLPEVGGVAVNYVNFGTSGHATTPDGLVLENYLRRAGHETALDLPAGLRAPHLDPADLRNYHPLNARISSVIRPARAVRFEIPHYPVYRPGFHAVTENHEPLAGAIAPFTSVRKLRMNHYWTKSEEECRLKFARGRSDQAGTRKWPEDFLHRERALNEVVDTEILAWLEPLRRALGVAGPSVPELAAAAERRVARSGLQPLQHV